MQEGRKDVGCMCVCLPLGFVPCVCLLFGIDRAWQPCKLPPPRSFFILLRPCRVQVVGGERW